MKTTVPIPTRMLVLGMVDGAGSLRADEVLPVARACGLGPEQVRSCLRRLVAEGVLTREGSGVSAHFAATARGLEILGGKRERFRIGYRQDRGAAPWDGTWRLVAFAFPETRRAARHQFRERLRELGGSGLYGGVYVSARPWETLVLDEAKRLEGVQHVSLLSSTDLAIGDIREPLVIARTLWPIDELEQRYRAFLIAYDGVIPYLEELRDAGASLADATFLPGALEIAVAFAGTFDLDPLLPQELLPRPWVGAEARALLLRRRRLALEIREAQGRPSLFSTFDATLEDYA